MDKRLLVVLIVLFILSAFFLFKASSYEYNVIERWEVQRILNDMTNIRKEVVLIRQELQKR